MDNENKRKPGRPKGSKNVKMTATEVEVFIKRSINKIMKDHLSWKEYIKWCKGNGLSEMQGNTYWKRSWQTIREKYNLEKDKQIHKHLLSYWKLYDEAIDKGDLSNARQTLDAIAKLMGLNEPDKLDMNATGEIAFKFGDE
jgi:hypothetical protein